MVLTMKKRLLKKDYDEADRLHQQIQLTIQTISKWPEYKGWTVQVCGTWLWIDAPGVKYKSETDKALNELGLSYSKSKRKYFLPGLPSKGVKHQTWYNITRYYGHRILHGAELSAGEQAQRAQEHEDRINKTCAAIERAQKSIEENEYINKFWESVA